MKTHNRILSQIWIPGKYEAQLLGQGPRQWPFSALLLSLILVLSLLLGSYSLFYSRIPPRATEDEILLEKYGLLYNKTIFGETLLPTPWQRMHSPLGPNVYNLERAYQILNCSTQKWSTKIKLPPITWKLTNATDSVEEECPSYFHWIQKDLEPWKESGISQTSIDMAQKHAAFKVVILKGKLYVDLYYACFQTRVLFTVWGMLLLLDKYKKQVPDVEIMFNCMDRPHIDKSAEGSRGFPSPPPLFSYCSNRDHYDIPWPDWSFWGWSELQMESWDQELDKIMRGSQKKRWRSKIEKAYWSGNPFVGAPLRNELVKCPNATTLPKTDIHIQNWKKELTVGKQHSKLEDQCNHRYMIYVEGVGWSVSLKYIMACGSPTLVISPTYYDFFMRGLRPWVHYIPVRPSESCAAELCPTINGEVNFAELNPLKANEIGKAGQAFVGKEVGMKNVYGYMFHMLSEYAKLQKFQPSIRETAHLVTQDYLLCIAQPLQRLLLQQARKLVPYGTTPCSMSKASTKGFKDFAWEAPEHINKKCSH